MPRWLGESKVPGITNVGVDDIKLDAPKEVKHNILSACNKVSLQGYNEGVEFATILNAKTGKVVEGHELIRGEPGSVSLEGMHEMIEKSPENSLLILHNHTNGTTFSIGDAKFLFESPAVSAVLVATGEEIHMIRNTAETIKNSDAAERFFKAQMEKETFTEETTPEEFIAIIQKAFVETAKQYKIHFEEWV